MAVIIAARTFLLLSLLTPLQLWPVLSPQPYTLASWAFLFLKYLFGQGLSYGYVDLVPHDQMEPRRSASGVQSPATGPPGKSLLKPLHLQCTSHSQVCSVC